MWLVDCSYIPSVERMVEPHTKCCLFVCYLLIKSCWWGNLPVRLQKKAGWGLKTRLYCAGYSDMDYITLTWGYVHTFLYVKQQKLGLGLAGNEASMHVHRLQKLCMVVKVAFGKEHEQLLYTTVIHWLAHGCVTLVAALARQMAALSACVIAKLWWGLPIYTDDDEASA